MDLISVIVPVYKVEKYLDRCVQSIVEQTYSNLEIILVDDGSPDNCGAMCDAWAEKDSRIRVIHKENGGLSDARNAGMVVACGQYIAFIDSDDWVDNQYISAMYHAIITYKADIAACDILVTSEYCIRENEVLSACVDVVSPEEAIEDVTYGRRFRAVAWNKLYSRELLAGEKFPVGKYHEDEFFTYRILGKTARLAFVDQPLYYYFQRRESIMGTFSMKRLDAFDAYLERLTYLKERYPRLYSRDKLQFCVSCAMFYREALRQDLTPVKKKIIEYRKQISFGMHELRDYNLQQRIYIMGTGICMDAFCKLLNLKSRKW